jgi:hypothetical protein
MKDGEEGAEIASLLESVVVGVNEHGEEITSLVVKRKRRSQATALSCGIVG